MWSCHPDCRRVVQRCWLGECLSQSAACDFQQKLRCTTQRFKTWNKLVFGHLQTTIEDVKQQLLDLQSSFKGQSSVHREQELQLKLSQLLVQEEIFWQQKSRVSWL
ncbi:hypothetical protein NE237_023900 [Protea cynaroides]|uniref:Uncharacterized protein n=1 Tax=Protea cynaroides TaxID=273540 RepID=A0A9Q0K5L9_9MAGN|nr:hypothetical protein NE237_023900 [Protea cynaroides]